MTIHGQASTCIKTKRSCLSENFSAVIESFREFFSTKSKSEDKEPQAAEPFGKHGIELQIASGIELIYIS